MSHVWREDLAVSNLVHGLVPDLATEVEEEGKGVDAEGCGDVDHCVPSAVQTWNKYGNNTEKKVTS